MNVVVGIFLGSIGALGGQAKEEYEKRKK